MNAPSAAPPQQSGAESLEARFLAPFENLRRAFPPAEAERRRRALERLRETGLPGPRDEDWRFTDLSPIWELPFEPLGPEAAAGIPAPEALASLTPKEDEGPLLVFVDGVFMPELSRLETGAAGVRATSWSRLRAEDPERLLEAFGEDGQAARNPFAALNEAYFQDGLFLEAEPGARLEAPIVALCLSRGARRGAAAHLRHVIRAGPGSRLRVLEHYAALGPEPEFTNALSRVAVGEGAAVELTRLQNAAAAAAHLGTVIAELAKRGSLAAHSVALGARLSRQQLFPRLVGEEADCLLNGLYLTDGERTADHFMVVDHIAPRCESREHFNGVLLDRSRGVFHGRILVRPQAQKTDARQTNKNLLLSEEARAHTKPQLEIYADDVRCTHGATVGRLSAEALFYLRSRGIGPEDARRFLVHAFAGEILERIGPPAVRDRIHRLVWERLAAADLNAVSGALD